MKYPQVLCLLGALLWFTLPKLEGQTIHDLDSLKNLLLTADDTSYVNHAVKISVIYFQNKMLDSMEELTLKVIDKAEKAGYKKQIYAAYDIYASALQGKGDYSESLRYYKIALKGWKELQDDRGLSKTYNNLGRFYHLIHAYDKAYDCYLNSLKLAEKLGDQHDIHIAYQNMGFILNTLERTEDALRYKRKVARYAKENNNSFMEAVAYMSIGGIHRDLEVYDSAFYYFNEVEKIAHETANVRMQISAAQLQAYTAIKSNQYERALSLLKPCFDKIPEDDYLDLSYYFNYLAEALFGLKKHREALQAAETAMDYAQKDNTLTLLNNANFQLYEFHKKLGNTPLSLAYHEAYKEIQDSIYNQDKLSQVHNLEVQYETEKKEAEILSLQQTAQINGLKFRQRGLVLGFLVLAALLLLGFLFFIYRQRLLQESLKRIHTEQRLLRTQMNPHFFFHALSSIQDYLLQEEDPKKSVRYLSKFSKLMRNVLDSSRTESISLEEEIQTLENYLALQQLRFKQGFQYEIKVDQALRTESFSIPPLLFQPIVENAIENSLIHKDGQGQLSLDFSKVQSQLQITIADNGITSLLQSPNENSVSSALAIVKDRLDLLKLKGEKKPKMEIIQLKDQEGIPTGTKIVFQVPLEIAI